MQGQSWITGGDPARTSRRARDHVRLDRRPVARAVDPEDNRHPDDWCIAVVRVGEGRGEARSLTHGLLVAPVYVTVVSWSTTRTCSEQVDETDESVLLWPRTLIVNVD